LTANSQTVWRFNSPCLDC